MRPFNPYSAIEVHCPSRPKDWAMSSRVFDYRAAQVSGALMPRDGKWSSRKEEPFECELGREWPNLDTFAFGRGFPGGARTVRPLGSGKATTRELASDRPQVLLVSGKELTLRRICSLMNTRRRTHRCFHRAQCASYGRVRFVLIRPL